MPKFPEFSHKVKNIKNAVFEKFRSKMDAFGPQMIRLHIGDTYELPYYALPFLEKFTKKRADFNRYCNTFGIPELRRELTDKLKKDNHFTACIGNVIITAGATNGLSAALHAILNPEDEILVFTPCWPIFPGLVHSVPATIVEVPFYLVGNNDQNVEIDKYLSQFISPKTAVIYLNSPNNPSGRILDIDQLREIGRFAARHNLWILSDEAYDGLTYDGRQNNCIGSFPEFAERTISVFTFSKLYMFAGLRLAYVVANEAVIQNVNKTMVHQLYSPSTIAQQIMIEPVQTRYQWMKDVQSAYQNLRDIFFKHLGLLDKPPQAGYFMFFSLEPFLGSRTYDQVINKFLEHGVSVAPGDDFGQGYEHYIRVCFTGEPPERLIQAAQTIRNILLQDI